MALKDTWKDRTDDDDFVLAEDINNVAHAVIDLEKGGGQNALPIIIGEGENSVISPDSRALSDNSYALGENCVSGRKGYYIEAFDLTNKKIYLSDIAEVMEVPPTPILGAGTVNADFETPAYVAGDDIYIIFGGHYDMIATVVDVKNNVVTYAGDLGSLKLTQTPAYDDYTFSCPSNPTVGLITLGQTSAAFGQDNKAASQGSFAAGRNNIVGGNYGVAFGRNNKVGYAGIVSGFGNTADGNGTSAFGYYNEADESNHALVVGTRNTLKKGHNNLIAGHNNTSSGEGNLVAGYNNNTSSGNTNLVTGSYNNTSSGSNNLIAGRSNKSSGDYNFVFATKGIATGEQTVIGRYNQQDSSKVFIIGGGSSDSKRQNVFTIDRNGTALSPNIDLIQDSYIYVFDSPRAIEKSNFSAVNTVISYEDGALKSTSTTNDPMIVHNFNYPLDGTQYKYIKIRYKNTTENLSSILWFATSSASYGNTTRKKFNTIGDSKWHDVILDMSQLSTWDSQVTSIRLDLPNTADVGGTVYLKYIALFATQEDAENFGTALSPNIDLIQDSYIYVFDSPRAIEKSNFSAVNTVISYEDGALKSTSTTNDPMIVHNFNYPLDGTQYKYIKIRYKNTTENLSSILWFATSSASYGNTTRKKFNTIGDSKWHDVILDMSQLSTWDSQVTSIRLDLPNTADVGGTVYLKYIALFATHKDAMNFGTSSGYLPTIIESLTNRIAELEKKMN